MENSETTEEALSVRNFVASRIQEIKSLSSQIAATATPESKGLAFQHVPKHMRRRAVSHNPKRLPSRLREKHIHQVKKSSGAVIKKSKVPSRKYRRRKSNLLLEYNRRQRSSYWMETHIWHAKRFHVKENWGCKIPISPCDKGYRSLYRGFKEHCVMQDMSFYSFLQLQGPNIIREFQNKFKDTQVAFKMYENGQREGTMFMYSNNESLSRYIGRVQFIALDDSSLILWVHPAFKEEIVNELIIQFELYVVKNNTSFEIETDANIDTQKLIPKQLSNPTVYKNQGITMTDLTGALSRIRLLGPKSTAVLREVLRPTIFAVSSSDNSTWWEEWYKDRSELLTQQMQLWESLKSVQNVPWSTVIPLTVRDPRVFLPGQRKSVNAVEEKGDFEELLKDYQATSPLWIREVRQRVLKEKMEDREFSKQRSQLLIPGSELVLGRSENQVPLIVIHQPKGWDLIIPAGWTMAFWVSLSYNCVRACGLRDSIHFALEEGSIHSPEFLPPDSAAGKLHDAVEGQEKRDVYFRLPPAKRSNFIKLGCPFPFQINWSVLLNYWNENDNVTVIRNKTVLSSLDRCLRTNNNNDSNEGMHYGLVGVTVLILGRGNIQEGATICLPQETDFVSSSLCSEPMFDDYHENERATLQQNHQKIMAFLRKKRKRNKERREEFDSTKISENFNASMEKLWLPNEFECLQSMSRKPIGFVTVSGETYSIGKCSGLGFCTYQGIKEFLTNKQKFVLVRNCRNTLEFRRALLRICKL